jgi:protoheme IX farnesyltransferase
MNSRAEGLSPAREAASALHAFVQLTKPGITRMVLLTTLCGALAAPGAPDLVTLAVSLLAMFGVVGGANALNMYWERDTDALMERTRSRPLPAGRLAPEQALWFGLAVAAGGLGLLVTLVNPLSAGLAALGLFAYVAVYTPLKKVTPWALYVGAIPGAVPPLVGWSSMVGSIGSLAWQLSLILLVWQLPHFVAISIFRSEEYRRAKLPVLPNVHGLPSAKRAMVLQSLLLLAATLLPVAAGDASLRYAAVATALGIGFVAVALWGQRAGADARWARVAFFVSMPHLAVVFAALVVDRAV